MVKRRVGGLVQAYVFTYLCCFYRVVTLGCVDGIIMFYDIDKLNKLLCEEFICYPNDKNWRLTMKMKYFKAALESKLRFAEKNIKVEDDFYMGYISCMEDILVFINGDEKELNNDVEGLSTENGSTGER